MRNVSEALQLRYEPAGFDCVQLLPVNTRKSTRLSRHVNWTLRRRWVIHTIRSLRYPLGIFCYNDCVAADIVDACIEAEIQIPDQVAVLGVDNDPVICDCVQVPLSSVRHDLEGMAYEAAALLDSPDQWRAATKDTQADPAKGSRYSQEHRGPCRRRPEGERRSEIHPRKLSPGQFVGGRRRRPLREFHGDPWNAPFAKNSGAPCFTKSCG